APGPTGSLSPRRSAKPRRGPSRPPAVVPAHDPRPAARGLGRPVGPRDLALPVGVGADREHAQERLLRHLDPADLLHPLLAFLLLLEQLALARDVAAVALGDHVLAHGLDRLARDDLRADRGLDRDPDLLPRDPL